MLTMKEIIRTFYNALLQKLKNHRGNWNQNDPTADDYIKNRPFYTDDNENTVIIRNTNVTIDMAQNGAAAEGGFATITYSPVIEMIVGQSYIVTWDGRDYECTAYEVDGIAAVGDSSLMMYRESASTGEPFFIVVSKNYFNGAYICANEIGTHTVQVIQYGKVVPIDKKYLPNDLVDQDGLDSQLSYVYDDLYNIPTDTVRYNVGQNLSNTQKAQARTNIGAVSSDEITGVVKYSESQTLTDWQKTQARTNIGAGIPQVQADWNEYDTSKKAHILNRVCYEDVVDELITKTSVDKTPLALTASTSEYNGIYYSSILRQNPTITDYDILYIKSLDLTFVKKYVSHNLYAFGNAYLCITMGKNGFEEAIGLSYLGYIEGRTIEDTGESFCILCRQNAQGDIVDFLSTDPSLEITNIYGREITLKQLDEKFIPDTIQRTGAKVIVSEADNSLDDKYELHVDASDKSIIATNQSNGDTVRIGNVDSTYQDLLDSTGTFLILNAEDGYSFDDYPLLKYNQEGKLVPCEDGDAFVGIVSSVVNNSNVKQYYVQLISSVHTKGIHIYAKNINDITIGWNKLVATTGMHTCRVATLDDNNAAWYYVNNITNDYISISSAYGGIPCEMFGNMITQDEINDICTSMSAITVLGEAKLNATMI